MTFLLHIRYQATPPRGTTTTSEALEPRRDRGNIVRRRVAVVRKGLTSGYATRRFALALVIVAALGWSAVAAHAQSQSGQPSDSPVGVDKSGKTDRNPPPPPEGRPAPGVTVHTFTLDPAASREQRIADAMSQGGLSRDDAIQLVDGAPATGP